MFIRDRILRDLQDRIVSLERNSLIHVENGVERSPICGVEWPRYKEVSLKDAVLKVMDHCGIKLDYQKAAPATIKVTKKGK
jgi:hypothetical protein